MKVMQPVITGYEKQADDWIVYLLVPGHSEVIGIKIPIDISDQYLDKPFGLNFVFEGHYE